MDAVDLHALLLAEIGEALEKAATGGVDRAPMVKSAVGLRPPVPPIETSEPRRSFSSGQAARASRTWAKNLSA